MSHVQKKERPELQAARDALNAGVQGLMTSVPPYQTAIVLGEPIDTIVESISLADLHSTGCDKVGNNRGCTLSQVLGKAL